MLGAKVRTCAHQSSLTDYAPALFPIITNPRTVTDSIASRWPPVWSSRSCWEVTLTSEEECGSHIAGNSHLLCWGQHPRRALSIRGEAKRRRYISMIMEKIPRRKCRASSGPAPSSSPPSLCRTQVHCFHQLVFVCLFIYPSPPLKETFSTPCFR